MPNFWIQTPSDIALSEMQGWAQLGGNKFAAIRHHLLVVPSSEGKGKAKNGPVHRQMEWPIKATFEMVDEISNVTKYTYSIQESITSTITSKISQEVLSKVSASAALGLSKLEATLSSELQAKVGAELVEALQGGLSTTSTYSVETTRKQGTRFAFEVSEKDGTRPVFVYFKLRQLHWDVYLYRTEYLQLEYEKNWIWPNVRKTIVYKDISISKPLFRLVYFEPEKDFSYRFDNYEPEVENGDTVASLPLNSAPPNVSLQVKKTMEELARLAFPVSRRERDAAVRQRKALGRPGASARGATAPGGSTKRPSKASGAAAVKLSKKSTKSTGQMRSGAKKTTSKRAAKPSRGKR